MSGGGEARLGGREDDHEETGCRRQFVDSFIPTTSQPHSTPYRGGLD